MRSIISRKKKLEVNQKKFERKSCSLPVKESTCTCLKYGRPFKDFEFLIKLDKAKGIEVSNTYLNRNQGLEFGLAMADLLRSNLAKDFKTTLFFNRVLDECTDIQHLERVIIYV